MASERRKSSSRNRSALSNRPARGTVAPAGAVKVRAGSKQFAVCIGNEGYPASLELRKLYPVLKDSFADEHGLIRIVDESGEDYLYPNSYFVRVELPEALRQKLRKIA